MSLYELLRSNKEGLTDHDLAHLADWANEQKNVAANQSCRRAYSLIREGADLLLRRRAMSRCGEEPIINVVPLPDGLVEGRRPVKEINNAGNEPESLPLSQSKS